MAKTQHYDLGDAILRIDETERDGYLATLVQLDNPMGVVKLLEAQTHKLIDSLLEWSGAKAPSNSDAYAIIADLREQLAAAQADNDLAQAEIARLTAEKPRRGRPKKEATEAPPVDWDGVPAEPAADQGAQEDHLPGFAAGDAVEVIATAAWGTIDRVFADNPRKVVVLLGGKLPKVFDVTELRLAAPNGSDLQGSELHRWHSEEFGDPTGLTPQGLELDVPELVEALEAVGLTVLTEVPDVIVTELDPVKLRQALYDDSKLYGYTPDEMRALIAEIVGEPKTSKELDTQQLGAVLRTMHERGVQSRMPY